MEALVILMMLTQIAVLVCLILPAMRFISAVEKVTSAYEMSVLDKRGADPKSDGQNSEPLAELGAPG